jgi:TRAP-type C4-dicarboxylate transport system substrate-binding protein
MTSALKNESKPAGPQNMQVRFQTGTRLIRTFGHPGANPTIFEFTATMTAL